MCIHDRNGEHGFSLVELVLGIGVATLLIGVLASMLITAQRVQARTQAQMRVQRSGYAALERLAAQIALTGLNLNRSAGEEPLPELPPEVGADWGRALALQYRTEEGELKRFTYYLHDGQLMQLGDDGTPIPVTSTDCQVTDLSYTYYTYHDVELGPERLVDGRWREQVRRVEVKLVLDRGDGSPAKAHYELRTAVTLQNTGD